MSSGLESCNVNGPPFRLYTPPTRLWLIGIDISDLAGLYLAKSLIKDFCLTLSHSRYARRCGEAFAAEGFVQANGN